jgi:hypothetical protein
LFHQDQLLEGDPQALMQAFHHGFADASLTMPEIPGMLARQAGAVRQLSNRMNVVLFEQSS